MPDLATPGRDELRREIDKHVRTSEWTTHMTFPCADLLALLDQADAGAALAQRVIRAARLLGIANSDTEPNAAETQMLVDDILTHCAELEATAARRLELLRPFATAYDAWVAADSDTAIEITPDQACAAAAEVAADSP